jgi:hypothetical protein
VVGTTVGSSRSVTSRQPEGSANSYFAEPSPRCGRPRVSIEVSPPRTASTWRPRPGAGQGLARGGGACSWPPTRDAAILPRPTRAVGSNHAPGDPGRYGAGVSARTRHIPLFSGAIAVLMPGCTSPRAVNTVRTTPASSSPLATTPVSIASCQRALQPGPYQLPGVRGTLRPVCNPLRVALRRPSSPGRPRGEDRLAHDWLRDGALRCDRAARATHRSGVGSGAAREQHLFPAG